MMMSCWLLVLRDVATRTQRGMDRKPTGGIVFVGFHTGMSENISRA